MQAWLSRCWDHTLGAPGHRPGATRWLSAWGRVGVGPPHQLPSWGPLAALKDLTITTAVELRLEPRGRRPGGAFPAPAPGVLGAGGRGSPGPGPLWGRDELTPPPGAAGPSVCGQHSLPPPRPSRAPEVPLPPLAPWVAAAASLRSSGPVPTPAVALQGRPCQLSWRPRAGSPRVAPACLPCARAGQQRPPHPVGTASSRVHGVFIGPVSTCVYFHYSFYFYRLFYQGFSLPCTSILYSKS